jgi:hypothetical protein
MKVRATFYEIHPDSTYSSVDTLVFDHDDPNESRMAGRRMASCLRMGLAVLTVPVQPREQENDQ